MVDVAASVAAAVVVVVVAAAAAAEVGDHSYCCVVYCVSQ